MTEMIVSGGRSPSVALWVKAAIDDAQAWTIRAIVHAVLVRMHQGRRYRTPADNETIAQPIDILKGDQAMDADDAVVALGAALASQKIQSRVIASSKDDRCWTVYLSVLEEETGRWLTVDATKSNGLVLAPSTLPHCVIGAKVLR
jgi:hypothetical protein